ncbi:MAG: HAD-IC family P-type ATPase, partial [Pseudomonadota bacterium]
MRVNDPDENGAVVEPPAAPHAAETEEIARILDVDASRGLSEPAAAARRARHGENRLAIEDRAHWSRLLLRQFTSPLIIVLIAAAGLSALVGGTGDALVILAIVALNGALGFAQEWRAEQALAALQRMLSPKAVVLRDGAKREIDAALLALGDVVFVGVGDVGPADLRLLATTELSVDEAALTGESQAVRKSAAEVDARTPISGRAGMLYTGTTVANGRASGIVVGVGMQTEIGRIATLAQGVARAPTPLERRLGQLGRQLGAAALAVSVLVAMLGWASGRPLIDMVMTGISLAVAAVPEGLPAVVTITLALGVSVMARRKALLRHLKAAETLGAVDVICTDKTGTLTRNEMMVTRIWTAAGDLEVTGVGYAPEGRFLADGVEITPSTRGDLTAILDVARRCNNAELRQDAGGGWEKVGAATEAALLALARKAGPTTAETATPLAEFSFTSERKRMTVVAAGADGRRIAYVKGAPEVLL